MLKIKRFQAITKALYLKEAAANTLISDSNYKIVPNKKTKRNEDT